VTVDRRSVAGKALDVSAEVQLLVVGAGPAGIAAAIEGAQRGLSVMLVDENPVSWETMAESVPLHFGGRMADIVRSRNAMMEAMLIAAPALETAFELDVDVRLGTACIGLYANRDNLNWMSGKIAALVDEDNGSILVRFDEAIVACGRRDMGIAFEGWEQPGVLGATAAVSLATRYGALDGRRAIVLGSTPEAALDALALARAGVEVISLIEQADAPVASETLQQTLAEAGIAIRCGETVRRTGGSISNGVRWIELSGGERLDCDLVVLAVAAVPVVDLLDAAGCKLAFSAGRGGFTPVLGGNAATSMAGIRAVGDCAGIWAAKSADPAIAEAEGRLAAAAAHRSITGDLSESAHTSVEVQIEAAFDIGAYRKAWVQATVVETPHEPNVCQCEEVTAREILEVRPPRYLGWTRGANRPSSLRELLGEAPPHPDQIKRLTRAGMGPCQGRRCREQVQCLLALQAELPVADIPLAGYRAPVRPVPLSAAAPALGAEDPSIREEWDSWFGMPRQWTPFWDVAETYTVASLAEVKEHVSE
jgi:thioredoxin reductase